MARRPQSAFTTIRSEGALLPPELLSRVAETDKGLGGIGPTDYHLGPTERLAEQISRSWNRLVGLWSSFEPQLGGFNPNDPGTGATRDRWLMPLLDELGFGRVLVAKAIEIDGRSYPISHMSEKVPIHLVGAGLDLDRRARGVAGAAKVSPHSLVQDYLNRSEALWGIACNGRELRVLRDNVSLTRQAYLAFDLQAMFSGEAYSDFAVLWLIAHQSRFEAPEGRAEGCWLERWAEAARTQGTRALETLRQGVEEAIRSLGSGFLAHPANEALRTKLLTGELEKQDYYRQLLRLVYRFMFLFVAEDRDLLHPPGTPEQARSTYASHYSTARLRGLSERRRGTKHADLWRGLQVVIGALGRDEGASSLGLSYLGSALFSSEACPDLDRAECSNTYLLGAVRSLGFTQHGRTLRQIDYRNMGSEELGSIYESLLELHPEIHAESATFELSTAAGHERKTTGSYYTPTSLISALLDSTLDPVLEEAAVNGAEAILNLKVLDPACGSGHFLTAAAHRIARRLAAIRTDEPEPAPEAYRVALRDAIGRCVFGIDVNPMATELCKVSLWMEAVEPGKPLSFLDHHIVCGNSLLGTTPALLAGGIPDDAFTALEGDDKEVVKSLKKRNKEERGSGQLALGFEEPRISRLDGVSVAARKVAETDDSTPDSLREKGRLWRRLQESDELRHARLIADAWCYPFMAPKNKGTDSLTEGLFRRLDSDPDAVPSTLITRILDFADHFRFLHPHVAFPELFSVEGSSEEHVPETGWAGGFDAILGNPPWARVKLQEKRFFASRAPEIAAAPNKAARSRLLARLPDEDPALWAEYQMELRRYDAESHFFHESGRFPLAGIGDVNSYALFAELARQLLRPGGRTGLIVQTGIATDDTTKKFFDDLVMRRSLVAVYGFENEDLLFPSITNKVKFCVLITAAPGTAPTSIDLSFGNRQVADIPRHRFSLTAKDIARVNPNTRTCPVFRSPADADIVKRVHERLPILIAEGPPEENPWGIKFQRMFDMANDSHLFKTAEQLEAEGWSRDEYAYIRGKQRCLPLLEGKMIDIYNPRAGTYEGQTQAQANKGVLPATRTAVLQSPEGVNLARYWVDEREAATTWSGHLEWTIGWRDVGPKERTLVPTVVPAWALGHSILLAHLAVNAKPSAPALLAVLSSFLGDYLLRQRTDKGRPSYFIVKQLPVPSPSYFEMVCAWDPTATIASWITPRVLELTYAAHNLDAFGRDFGYEHPFRWDEGRRELLRAELDAAVFLTYELGRDEAEHVMETFGLVRASDERDHGEYRTKRLILEQYDAITKASETGGQYVTILDPPPAHPSLAHAAVIAT